jgi:chaperone BCS1
MLLNDIQVTVQMTGTCTKVPDSVPDLAYCTLLKWLGKHIPELSCRKYSVSRKWRSVCGETGAILKSSAKVKGSSSTIPESEYDSSDEDECREPSTCQKCVCQFKSSPGYGVHYFWYKNCYLIRLNRRVLSDNVTMSSQEILELSTASWNEPILKQILELGKPKPKTRTRRYHKDRLTVFQAFGEGKWQNLGDQRRKRCLSTIILENDEGQKLLRDVEKFLSLEDWYVERGIPYRKAYLLYGPPGCGKSSIVKSIAGEIGYDICILSLNQRMTDDSFTELLNLAPKKSIVLLEDVDAAFASREDFNASTRETTLAYAACGQSSLTAGGFFNAMDGVGAAEDGLIIFMTTNYPERLDPALIRPGRVDYKVHLDYPSDKQLERMFRRFYPDSDDKLRAAFVRKVKDSCDKEVVKVSMAMVQGLFLKYRESPREAVDCAQSYFKQKFSDCNKKVNDGIYM